jgi:hypothetical protein
MVVPQRAIPAAPDIPKPKETGTNVTLFWHSFPKIANSTL